MRGDWDTNATIQPGADAAGPLAREQAPRIALQRYRHARLSLYSVQAKRGRRSEVACKNLERNVKRLQAPRSIVAKL